MSDIFISYRREDAQHAAGRLFSELTRTVPSDRVFMDIDNMPFGVDFVEVLEEKVSACKVLLAVIGSGWLDARDEHGNRRLDNPNDFVRIEIATALGRRIPVVPVLLDNTPMPRADALPEPLKALARRNAIIVSHLRFASDVERLLRGLNLSSSSAEAPTTAIKQSGAQPQAAAGLPEPGSGKTKWFKDIDVGPEMVVVPAGEFVMGEGGGQKKVKIASPFAVGRYAVTFAEWDAAVAAGGVAHKPSDQGWGRGRRPAINVSWDDAKSYVGWLSKVTKRSYRLLTEAEWEFCCRAGTTTMYSTGETITKQQAQFSEGEWRSAKQTVEVGSFPPNAWGLYDMHGNVWEWCENVYDSCSGILRGGSWCEYSSGLRSGLRTGFRPEFRGDFIGFRVARTL